MSDAEQVVREFLSRLEDEGIRGAVELMSDDIEWRNTGLPTVRGRRRVARLIRMLDDSPVEFTAELHQVAVTGSVVLTERTDTVRLGRWRARFGVRGTFEVADGLIRVWDDAFSWGALWRGSVAGVAGIFRRAR